MAVLYFASTADLVEWRGFFASPDNLPRPRPGVYIIQQRQSGKCYVGISHNLEKRLAAYVPPYRNTSVKFKRALQKYGSQGFIIIPAYYSVSGQHKQELPHLEAALIAQLNSVRNGYNTKFADGGIGPYGEVFAAIIRAAHQRPEFKAKLAAIFADPEFRKRKSKSQTLAMARPEVREKLSAASRAAMARPDVIARISAAVKIAQAKPEVKARVQAGLRVAAAKPEVKAKMRASTRASWVDPAIRARRTAALAENATRRMEKMQAAGLTYGGLPIQPSRPKLTRGEALRLVWANPEKRAKWIAAIPRKHEACRNGHRYTEETTIITPRGHRNCRICRELGQARNRAQNSLAQTLKRRAGRTAEEMKELHLQHLRRLADANRGKPLSSERRAKIGAANKGKLSPHRGKPLSQETRAKLSVVAKTRRIRVCLNGHPYTDENTNIDRQGHRHCKACLTVKLQRQRAFRKNRRRS